MRPAGFEPAIPATERPRTHALNRAAAGIAKTWEYTQLIVLNVKPGDTCSNTELEGFGT
jgi:hypothetical protein